MFTKNLVSIGMGVMLTSCSLQDLFFWQDQDQVVQREQQQQQMQQQEEDQEESSAIKRRSQLRISRLTNRIEVLEEKLRRQQEEFHLLKKGLMTGLIPSEWRDDLDPMASTVRSDPMSQKKAHTLKMMLQDEPASGARGQSGLSMKERERYSKLLANAEKSFRSGDYGKAILAYSEIGKEYSPKITQGSHLLWIGVSWYHLRDYQASRQHLRRLIKNHPTSPWVPEARFFMAKSDFQDGLVQRSLEAFKFIVNQYPHEGIADRAKTEIKRIETDL